MTGSRTVLVTGPAHGLEEYADAARAADWQVCVRQLLCIEQLQPQLDLGPDVALERILITSRNAIAGLELLAATQLELFELPCSVVGTRTAQVLSESGFAVVGQPARDAQELLTRLSEELPEQSTLLWPRGSLSAQLAHELRALGHTVLDPVIYETKKSQDSTSTPDTGAVFFASPSAVLAYSCLAHSRENRLTVAIAIGNTTRTQLESETEQAFSDILTLDRPAPEALTACLRNLRIES